MIVYKIDDKTADEALNTRLRVIAAELAAIEPTLQDLHTIVVKHEDTISSPSIIEFRKNLHRMVSDASTLTQMISQNSLTLIEVSERASKHLASVEEYFSTVLRDKTPVKYLAKTAETPVAK